MFGCVLSQAALTPLIFRILQSPSSPRRPMRQLGFSLCRHPPCLLDRTAAAAVRG